MNHNCDPSDGEPASDSSCLIDLTGAMRSANLQTLGTGGIYWPLDGRFESGPRLLHFQLLGNVRSISCWMTEATEDSSGASHAGGAIFTTRSVQFYENGTKVRVAFSHDLATPLRAGAQFFFLY